MALHLDIVDEREGTRLSLALGPEPARVGALLIELRAGQPWAAPAPAEVDAPRREILIDGVALGAEGLPLARAGALSVDGNAFAYALEERRAPWTVPVVALAVFVGLLVGGLTGWALPSTEPARTISWAGPVHRPGADPMAPLALPRALVRETGAGHREVTVRAVTDLDADGVDEVWLRLPDRLRISTFGPDGAWVTLGDLPADCRPPADPVGGAPGTSGVECGAVRWDLVGGQLRVAHQRGVVAWLPADAEGGRALVPHRVPLVAEPRLAGFLASRGVVEPVHYLVCEEALPGLVAQVRTDRGVVPLSYGCIREIELTTGAAAGPEPPAAVAFTVAGRDALVSDLASWLGGDSAGLFLEPDARALLARAGRPERWLAGGLRLSFVGEESFLAPVAAEAPLPPARPLGLPWAATPPEATTVVLDEDGPRAWDLPGCARLEVELGPWTCALRRWCVPDRAFAVVRETGCGRPRVLASASYGDRGVVRGTDGRIDVALDLDIAPGPRQVDVERARLSWRVRDNDVDTSRDGE